MTTFNQLLPVFLKTDDLRVLIIGGGLVAYENLKLLLADSPFLEITVVDELISHEVLAFSENKSNITLIDEPFQESYLENCDLVIVAMKQQAIAEEVCAMAEARNILVSVPENPDLCDFQLGQTVRRGKVKIAISTSGDALTSFRLQQVLQQALPDDLQGELVKLNGAGETLASNFAITPDKKNSLFSVRKWSLYGFGLLASMIFGHILFSNLPFDTAWNSLTNLISGVDNQFAWFILGGFIAQMIDGALGMAYGVSATTFLLSIGISPSVASMSVHTSEIFTSGVSGIMHLRFGNVNSKLFKSLVLPGIVGAITGAYLLTGLENYSNIIRPVVSLYTLFLGILIIVKVVQKNNKRKRVKRVGWLAVLGGFLDSIGGGGWGPVVSSTLIARGKHPRLIVGSVNLAEFFVSLASSFAFFSVLGTAGWQPIAGLILGGVFAAPIAAYFSSKLRIKPMMIFVGIVVIVVSLKNIISILF